jgi:hypothetical protein
MSNYQNRNSVDTAINSLRQELSERYPDLTVSWDRNKLIVKGSFPIVYEGMVLTIYQIEIEWPSNNNKVPILRETAGRIPWVTDRHMNPTNGEACLLVPEEWLVRPSEEKTLLNFLDGPVRNFFIGQSLVDRGEPWPWGERPHGYSGLIEAYGEMLGIRDERAVCRCLDYLSRSDVKGHWDCYCGSGQKLRKCHIEALKSLRKEIPQDVARSALDRLAKTPKK